MPKKNKRQLSAKENVNIRYKKDLSGPEEPPCKRVVADDEKIAMDDNCGRPLIRPKLINNRPICDISNSNHSANNFICNNSLLFELISKFPCPLCYKDSVLSASVKIVNLSAIIIAECKECKHQIEQNLNTETLPRTLIQGSSEIGIGQKQLNTLFSISGLPLLDQRLYELTLDKNIQTTHEAYEELIKKSRDTVHKNYIELGAIPDENGNIEIDVSYDGSWMSRGFSSQYGVGAVIDCISGLVLDISTLSKYCHKCQFAPKQEPLLSEWKSSHEHECQKNYSGSSPSMEVGNATILWKRSVEHGFIYKTMMSDGDAKTILHLNSLNVYGDAVEIEKRECVNHVSKRLGTALRKVKQTAKVGGKGYGKLTDTKITKLTNYYGKAIRSNTGDIEAMKRAIYATVMHCSSTDKEPKHSWCPKFKDS